jgi:hypothetical protein
VISSSKSHKTTVVGRSLGGSEATALARLSHNPERNLTYRLSAYKQVDLKSDRASPSSSNYQAMSR